MNRRAFSLSSASNWARLGELPGDFVAVSGELLGASAVAAEVG